MGTEATAFTHSADTIRYDTINTHTMKVLSVNISRSLYVISRRYIRTVDGCSATFNILTGVRQG